MTASDGGSRGYLSVCIAAPPMLNICWYRKEKLVRSPHSRSSVDVCCEVEEETFEGVFVLNWSAAREAAWRAGGSTGLRSSPAGKRVRLHQGGQSLVLHAVMTFWIVDAARRSRPRTIV